MSKKIGQLLIDRGVLNKAQLQTALRTQEFFGGHLGSLFIELGFISEATLGKALEQSTGARFAPPEFLENIPREIYTLIPAKLAEKHQLVPMRVIGDELQVAMLRPKDLRAVNEVEAATGMRVLPYVAAEFRILECLKRYYRVVHKRRERILVEAQGGEPKTAGAPAAPPPGPSAQAPAGPPETAGKLAAESVEIGLDGLPLDAEFELQESFFSTEHARQKTDELLDQLPRDLHEWRESVGESAPLPATPAAPPAASAVGMPPAAALPPDPARPMVSMPPPVSSADINPVGQSARRLLEARTRDEVGEILLQETDRFFQRRLLFIVQRDRIVGWDGAGSGVRRDRVMRAVLPAESLSMFTAVKVGSRPMVGPVADVPANRRLFSDLDMEIPTEVVLIPIRIKDRVVAILYGDNRSERVGSIDVDLLRRFTRQSAIALEILILRGKLLAS